MSGCVTVSDVEASADGAWATVAFGTESHRVGVWDLPTPPPVPADIFVLAATLIAMYRHETVHIDGEVSSRLLDTLPAAQSRYSRWFPRLTYANVTASTRRTDVPAPPEATTALFSGGLDSFHTAVTHPELDALVFVRGIDIGLDDSPVFDTTISHVRAAAAALNRPLVEITTDMKVLMYAVNQEWGWYYWGPLAGAAVAMGGFAGLVLHSASTPDALLTGEFAPLLVTGDLSTGYLDFIRTGQEATRVDKAREVSDVDAVRHNLRVCWQNLDEGLNCGVCEKCVRTAVSFELAGALARIRTLPDDVDLEAVRRLPARTRSECWFIRENLITAEQQSNPELTAALQFALTAPDDSGGRS